MTLQELTSAFISTRHGWAVAEQFNHSYETNDFKSQNPNALEYIKNCIKDLLESDLLAESETEDLVGYYQDLKQHILNH